jgi:hypothetical protein
MENPCSRGTVASLRETARLQVLGYGKSHRWRRRSGDFIELACIERSLASRSDLLVILLGGVSARFGAAQSGPQLVADRYSYLSCLSWAVLSGGVLLFFFQRAELQRRGFATAAAIGFGAMSITAAPRIFDMAAMRRLAKR